MPLIHGIEPRVGAETIDEISRADQADFTVPQPDQMIQRQGRDLVEIDDNRIETVFVGAVIDEHDVLNPVEEQVVRIKLEFADDDQAVQTGKAFVRLMVNPTDRPGNMQAKLIKLLFDLQANGQVIRILRFELLGAKRDQPDFVVLQLRRLGRSRTPRDHFVLQLLYGGHDFLPCLLLNR
ncbi:hypothetical protein D3C76_840630 [compost metagenome]